jgi:nucleoside-diphosphate-sugar epimerase
MRIFVTGATGYVGSALVTRLAAAGHDVIGLARSEAAAAALRARGIAVHRGHLEDHQALQTAAGSADAVVHTAFVNPSPTTDYAAASEIDAAAIRALGAVLEDTGKPLVVTSATGLVSVSGRAAAESDPANWGPRVAGEQATIALAANDVRAVVVRLSISVHDGRADRSGFVPGLIARARETGVSAYVGDGSNRWTAVHLLDAVEAFRIALDAPAGSVLHAVGEEQVRFRLIAEQIGAGLGVAVASLSPEQAPAHFGYLARFVAHDNPTSSALTRSRFGWVPSHRGLLDDIAEGGYLRVDEGATSYT